MQPLTPKILIFSLTRKIDLNVVCSGPSSRLIRALHLNSPEQVSAEPQNTLRFAFSQSLFVIVVFHTPNQFAKPIRRLTIKKSQKNFSLRSTDPHPNLLNFERTPLDRNPNPLNLRPETSDHLRPKPQTPDRFSPKPGLDSPFCNPSIRYVAYNAIATCTLDLVICTLEHTFSAFWL